MNETNLYSDIPPVYKKDKATLVLLVDGIIDLSIGIMYFLFFRNLILILTAPIQEAALVRFNIILFFDIIIFLEFFMATLELLAVYFTKFTENQKIPELIKRLFIVSHVILIPLGGLINYVLDLILM